MLREQVAGGLRFSPAVVGTATVMRREAMQSSPFGSNEEFRQAWVAETPAGVRQYEILSALSAHALNTGSASWRSNGFISMLRRAIGRANSR